MIKNSQTIINFKIHINFNKHFLPILTNSFKGIEKIKKTKNEFLFFLVLHLHVFPFLPKEIRSKEVIITEFLFF